MATPTLTTDRDLKFYIWLLTHGRHPTEKIKQYENDQTVEKFDEYDTFDSRGLLYVEDSIREVTTIVREENIGFTHTPMPMFLYRDQTIFKGINEQKNIILAKKKPVTQKQVHDNYIWENKKQVHTPIPIETARTRPIKQKDDLTSFKMPSYNYYDNKVTQGKVQAKYIEDPIKKAVQDETLQPVYIYRPPVQIISLPESEIESKRSNKVILLPVMVPLVISEKVLPMGGNKLQPDLSKDTFMNPLEPINISPNVFPNEGGYDEPLMLLPNAPLFNTPLPKEIPVKVEEDHTPVIIPIIIEEPVYSEKKVESPKKNRRPDLNENLMKSYKDKTENMEKEKLMKLDDLDHEDDMFIPVKPHHNKDPSSLACNCPMCIKNASRIKLPIKKKFKPDPNARTPKTETKITNPDEAQRAKFDSRINRLPKRFKPIKTFEDPYKHKALGTRGTRPSQNRGGQPDFGTKFDTSLMRFMKKNLDDMKVGKVPKTTKK